jgi:hypothetical protein
MNITVNLNTIIGIGIGSLIANIVAIPLFKSTLERAINAILDQWLILALIWFLSYRQ